MQNKKVNYRPTNSTNFRNKVDKRQSKPFRFLYRPIYYRGRLGLYSKLLKYIYGLNHYRAFIILTKFGLSKYSMFLETKKFVTFKTNALRKIEKFISTNFLNGHRLKRFIIENIKTKAKDPNALYTARFYRYLPIRGQRTKTNSRTTRSFFKPLTFAIRGQRYTK